MKVFAQYDSGDPRTVLVQLDDSDSCMVDLVGGTVFPPARTQSLIRSGPWTEFEGTPDQESRALELVRAKTV